MWHLTISDTFLPINIILGRSGTTSSRAGCGYLKHTAFQRVCGTEWKSVPRRAFAGWRTQKQKRVGKTNIQNHKPPNTSKHTVNQVKEMHTESPPRFLFFFFWRGSFLKSLLNLLQHCFCFVFRFFGGKAYRLLAPQPGIKLNPLHWKVKSSPLDHQGSPSPDSSKVFILRPAPSSLCAISMVPWERDRAGDKLLQRPQSSLNKLSLKSRLLTGWLGTPLLSHSHSPPRQVKGQRSWPPTWQVWIEIPDEESGSIPIHLTLLLSFPDRLPRFCSPACPQQSDGQRQTEKEELQGPKGKMTLDTPMGH